MKISKEVKIGIIVVVSIALFIYGFNFLKGSNLFNPARKLSVTYNYIEGLVPANPVLVNGFKVGQVSDIKIEADAENKVIVKVELLITDDIGIPENTVARVISSDFLGSKAVSLEFSKEKTFVKSGDALLPAYNPNLSQQISAQIAPFKNKIDNLLMSTDSVMLIVSNVLNVATRENLQASFLSVKNTLTALEHTSKKMDTIITGEKGKIMSMISKVESISANFEKNNDKINTIIQNFQNISDTLAKARVASAINNASQALYQTNMVMEKINSGKGTIGMLVNNDSLYRKLDQSAQDLDLLMKDLRINPERYLHFSVFGRKDRSKPVQ